MKLLANVLRASLHTPSSFILDMEEDLTNVYCPAAGETELTDECRYLALIMTSLRRSLVTGPYERNALPALHQGSYGYGILDYTITNERETF